MNAHPAALADAKLIAIQSLNSSAEVKSKSEQSLSGSFSSLRTLLTRAARPKNNGTMFSATAILTMAQMKKSAMKKPGNGWVLDPTLRGYVPVVRMLTRVSLKISARFFSRSLAFDLRDFDSGSEEGRSLRCA